MITGIVVALLLAVIVFQYMTIKIDKDNMRPDMISLLDYAIPSILCRK